jgi:hypothetical protein
MHVDLQVPISERKLLAQRATEIDWYRVLTLCTIILFTSSTSLSAVFEPDMNAVANLELEAHRFKCSIGDHWHKSCRTLA